MYTQLSKYCHQNSVWKNSKKEIGCSINMKQQIWSELVSFYVSALQQGNPKLKLLFQDVGRGNPILQQFCVKWIYVSLVFTYSFDLYMSRIEQIILNYFVQFQKINYLQNLSVIYLFTLSLFVLVVSGQISFVSLSKCTLYSLVVPLIVRE